MAVWSEVNLKSLTNDGRMDSDYYRPEYLLQEQQIDNISHVNLEEVASVSDGNHLSISEDFVEEGVRYLRGQDLSEFFVSDTNPVYISYANYELLTRSHIKTGDVLLSIVGTVGNVAFVTPKYDALTGSCKIAILRPFAINSLFLAAYLVSRVGQDQLKRRVRGAVQQGLILPDLKHFPVPQFSESSQRAVAEIVENSHSQRARSLEFYAEAEMLLLDALGLNDLDATHDITYECDFREVSHAGRFDAEYYRPKYTKLVGYLQKIPHTKVGIAATLAGGATPLGANYLDEGIPFLRIQNVGNSTLIRDDIAYIDDITHNELLKRSQLQPHDVLITITGRIGTAAVFPNDMSRGNINQHIVRLRLQDKELDPYYVAAFLNSYAGRFQTEREAYGSTREALPYYCLEQIIIPKLPGMIQSEVRNLILEAHQAAQDAQNLLETAKRRVEELIEGGA